MIDPRIICLDLETYGKCETNWDGDPLPKQTVFQPTRSLIQDGVHLFDLILSAAITLPQEDPRCSTSNSPSDCTISDEKPLLSAGNSSPTDRQPKQPSPPPSSKPSSMTTFPLNLSQADGWDMTSLLQLREGSSLVFRMNCKQHRRMLLEWVKGATTILAMNGVYDITYLRKRGLEWQKALSGSQILIDLSIFNYLHNEMRPEKSLKDLSPILQTHIYRDEESGGFYRYPSPTHRDEEGHGLLTYNCDDTHATLLGIIELTRRIRETYGDNPWPPSLPALSALSSSASASGLVDTDQPTTDKLSPFSLRFYSDAMWTVIRMSEAGLCFDRAALTHFENQLIRKCQMLCSIMWSKHSVILEGDGSEITKLQLMEQVCTFIEEHINEYIRQHPLFTLTDKKKQISINDVNRRLFEHTINDALNAWALNEPQVTEANTHLEALHLLGLHIKYQKLLSSYTWPYLRYRRKKPDDHKSKLIKESDRCLHAPTTSASSTTTSPTKVMSPTESSPGRNSNGSSRGTRTGKAASTGSPSGKTSEATPAPPATPSLESESRARKRMRRQRTPNQWLKRHQQRLLRRGRSGTPSQQQKAREKAATPTPTTVDYSPVPVEPRVAWMPLPLTLDRTFSHPTWFVTPSHAKDAGGDVGGTLQGRITCKGGAHQTDPPAIKHFYISRYEGGLLVWYDLEQIEMRGAALVSGDDTLCSAFDGRNPRDLHTERAIFWFGKEVIMDSDFKEMYRQPAKHSNFTDLYLGGAKKLQETILKKGNVIVPLEQCYEVVHRRAELRPGLTAWQHQHIANVQHRGYYEVPFVGQTRRFEGGDDFEENEIVNIPIQALAGNTLLRIQAYIHHHGPSLNDSQPPWLMCHQVYDAIVFDVRSPAALPQLDSLMKEAVNYVQDIGYWSWNQDLYDREIPIEYKRTITYGEPQCPESP